MLAYITLFFYILIWVIFALGIIVDKLQANKQNFLDFLYDVREAEMACKAVKVSAGYLLRYYIEDSTIRNQTGKYLDLVALTNKLKKNLPSKITELYREVVCFYPIYIEANKSKVVYIYHATILGKYGRYFCKIIGGEFISGRGYILIVPSEESCDTSQIYCAEKYIYSCFRDEKNKEIVLRANKIR